MTHAPMSDLRDPSVFSSLSMTVAAQRQVLVVEDHPPIRHAMNRLIKQAGFGVTLAGTIEEGMGALNGKDCLLLDLNLPDGCGVKLLRHVRERSLPIRVAVITATGEPKLLAEVAELKPDAMFFKPIDFAHVLRWMEQAPSTSEVNPQRVQQERSMAQRGPNFSWHMRWPRVGK